MLIFVRHGRTSANHQRRLQLRLDTELDEVGRAQAAATATMISGLVGDFDVIASPRRRAEQTAAAFGKQVTLEPRLVELAYGDYEGKKISEVPAEVWQQWRENPNFALPGGESLSALDARVREVCAEVVERSQERAIVLVSHVSPIKSAALWALGLDISSSWNCHLSHAAVCRIGTSGGYPVLLSFNEVAAWDSENASGSAVE